MARDQWRMSDDYDPERIHVKASDDDGHSWKGRVLFPKHWPGWISAIVESPDFPEYRQIHDFVRDAVFHRLHFWDQHPTRRTDPELASRLSLERMKNRLAASRDFSHEVASFRRELDDAVSELHQVGDYDSMERLLNEVEDEIRVNFAEPYLTDLLERVTYWRKTRRI